MLDFLALFREFLFFAAYLSTGSSFPEPLSPAEEKEALARLQQGDDSARETLIRHNLRLVAHVAKKYGNTGYDSEDLISIGTIGLIKAVSTFDQSKGAQLATYAARCIQNEILMSLRAGKKTRNEVSLGSSIGMDKEGNEITLVDIMGSAPGMVCDEVETRLQVERLRELMEKCLSKREKLVINLRYGLTQGACLPQREVAQILDISRSYVSRLEKKALEKLRREFEKSGGQSI